MVSLRNSTTSDSHRAIKPRRIYHPHMINGGEKEGQTLELTPEYNPMVFRSKFLNNSAPTSGGSVSSSGQSAISDVLRHDPEAGKAPLELTENELYERFDKEDKHSSDTVLSNPIAS